MSSRPGTPVAIGAASSPTVACIDNSPQGFGRKTAARGALSAPLISPAWGKIMKLLGRPQLRKSPRQGGEQGTYVVLSRSTRTDTGSPSGREAHGDGAVVVVRGRESRPHGEGPQVP